MKITKVDDYKFVRDEETGKIVKDKKIQLLKEMKHTDLDTYIRNSIKGKLLKNLKKDKDDNNSEILKGIKKIIRNINIKNKRVKLNENNIGNIKNAIKSMKNDTLSYSYIENNIFKNSDGLDGFINFLIEISKIEISKIDCGKDRGNKINGDIERTFSDKFKIDEIINLKNIEEDYSNWVKITQKSINNNKIISLDEDKMINNSNEKKASKRALFLEDLFEKLLKDDKSFDNKIEEYEKEYDIDSLITVIKIMDNKEVDFKEEDKKSKIDKVVKYIEENTFFPIIEEENKSSYLKNCLIKKSLIGYQKNFEKLQDARKNKSGLNYYDEEVIHYFNKYYPVKKNSKLNRFISLEDDIKNDEKFLKKEKIHKEIRYRLRNRAINLGVKKGQLIEYKDTKNRNVIKSQDLELMHIDDVFSRKMSSTISYAANTFRNEIFGKKTAEEVKKYCEDYNDIRNRKINSDFLGYKKNEKLDVLIGELESKRILDRFEYPNFYYYISKSIYLFRNNSFHYQNINLKDEDKVTDEIKSKVNENLEKRIEKIPENEILKAYNNSVFKHYNEYEIFNLYVANALFFPKENNKMPSFKNILKSYIKMSKFYENKILKLEKKMKEYKNKIKINKKEIEEYKNKIEEYKNKIENYKELYELYNIGKLKENIRSQKQAEKYLLLKLYNAKYKEILDEVLEISSEYYKKKIVSSTDVGHYNNIKAVIDNVCKYEKMIKLEECKKSDGVESLGNSEKYFWDLKSAIQKDKALAEIRQKSTGFAFDIENELVAEAFYKIYLRDFAEHIDNQIKENEYSKEYILELFKEFIKSNNIDKNSIILDFKIDDSDKNNSLIYNFYFMAVILSPKKLSELYNNLVSYKQAYMKIKECKTVKIFGIGKDYLDIDDVLKMLRILINSTDNNRKYENLNEHEYADILRQFINIDKNTLNIKDELKKYNEKLNGLIRNQLYIQTDSKTLIVFKQIIEADRENLLNRYDKYYINRKIRLKEVKEFCEIENKISDIYDSLENCKKEINKSRNNKDLKEKYTKNYREILEYQWLKNRILFNDVSKMNNLLIEIYSKLTGLVAVLEKNAIHILISKGFEIDNTKGVIKNIKKAISKDKSLNLIFGDIVSKENVETRNKLAHFHYLRDEDGIDFISQLNNIRELLNFDRKLKNAVTKTVIKTFDKYGFELKFEFKEHKIDKYSIKRKGFNDKYMTKNFKIDENKDYFLQMIKIIIFDGCEEF